MDDSEEKAVSTAEFNFEVGSVKAGRYYEVIRLFGTPIWPYIGEAQALLECG